MKRLVFVGCNRGNDVDDAVEWHDVSVLFEPIPEIAAELRERYSSPKYAMKCITVIEAACGYAPCRSSFNIYNTNGLSSSLGTVTKQAIEAYSNFDLSLTNVIDVSVVRLCDFMPLHVETLIVDAQGNDLTVLKSIEPWLASGRVDSIMAECDGAGFVLYDGLSDNSEGSIIQFMSRFPYSCERVPGRNEFNPDFMWTRI